MRKLFFIGMLILVVLLVFFTSVLPKTQVHKAIDEQVELTKSEKVEIDDETLLEVDDETPPDVLEWEKKMMEDAQKKSESTYKMKF